MTHPNIHPTLLKAPVRVAIDPFYHVPSLQQALDFVTNESKRGVHLVTFRDLPDERLREIAAASRWHEQRYGSSTFRYQGDCAELVLKHRKAGGV